MLAAMPDGWGGVGKPGEFFDGTFFQTSSGTQRGDVANFADEKWIDTKQKQ